MSEKSDVGEVLLEFYRIGDSIKVSAVDPVTGVEVAIVGPATATRQHLEQTAIRKLRYVLAKQRREREG